MQTAPLEFGMEQPWFHCCSPEIMLRSSGQLFKDTSNYALILVFGKYIKSTLHFGFMDKDIL